MSKLRKWIVGFYRFGLAAGMAFSVAGIIEYVVWPKWRSSMPEGLADMLLGILLMIVSFAVLILYDEKFRREAIKLLHEQER